MTKNETIPNHEIPKNEHSINGEGLQLRLIRYSELRSSLGIRHLVFEKQFGFPVTSLD